MRNLVSSLHHNQLYCFENEFLVFSSILVAKIQLCITIYRFPDGFLSINLWSDNSRSKLPEKSTDQYFLSLELKAIHKLHVSEKCNIPSNKLRKIKCHYTPNQQRRSRYLIKSSNCSPAFPKHIFACAIVFVWQFSKIYGDLATQTLLIVS